MERLPGRRDPLRVGVAAEELGLLRVGPVGARDEQRHAVLARGALHAVEGLGDVGPHRLALAVLERAVVAAAVGEGGEGVGHELGLGVRDDRDAPALAAAPDLRHVAHRHADADRRERALVGERDRRLPRAVGARDRRGRRPRTGQVLGPRQVAWVGSAGDHGGLEQPRVVLVHSAGAGERREVRGARGGSLLRHPACHGPQDEHADEHGSQGPDQQHRRLSPLSNAHAEQAPGRRVTDLHADATNRARDANKTHGRVR
jgi:hypothetical protein